MNILITGGGTGGHIYPGIALLTYFKKKGHNVYFVASDNKVDHQILETIVELEKFKIQHWKLSGFQRKITIKNMYKNSTNIFKLMNCFYKANKILSTKKIDCVIGVGGYISFPLVYIASKKNIKTIIHEQNSYPGLVNRKLASKVDIVAITYESSKKYFAKANKIIKTSNPRTNECFEYVGKNFSTELSLDMKKEKILFIGGSLGAETINTMFAELAQKVDSTKIQCILIGGLRNKQNLDKQDSVNKHIILEYTDELLKYIASSDIIVSRGGATTILEILYLQKKSIIIPSPNVVANHQVINAREFKKQNLLTYIEEKNLTVEELEEKIKKVKNNVKMDKYLKDFVKIDSLEIFEKILGEIDEV